MKWPCAFIIFLLAVPVFGQGAQKLANPLAVILLNNADLRAQNGDLNKVPLFTRVYALEPNGECDDGRCPHTQIYIALSSFDEYPDQVVWVLDGGIDFKVLSIDGLNTDSRYFVDICISSQGDDRKQHQFLVEATLDKVDIKTQKCSE